MRYFEAPPASCLNPPRVYKTIEERCAACEVNGGDDPSCQSDREQERWQREHGRPCPRVELDARNVEPMQLLGWLIHDDLKPLAAQYARALLRGKSAGEREQILERVARVLRDKRVMDKLHPSLAEAEEPAQ